VVWSDNGVFMINFIGNIKHHYWKKKNGLLYYHLSFVFILWAFVTRYISYEGMMPIREGAAENQFYSDKTFHCFYRWEYKGRWNVEFWKPLLLSPVTNNNFSISDKFADTSFEVEYENFHHKEYVKQILTEFYILN
jgi:hypothetical protein